MINPNVYAYTREMNGEKILVALNFSENNASCSVDINTANIQLLLNNYKDAPVKHINGSVVSLRPYEALVYKIN